MSSTAVRNLGLVHRFRLRELNRSLPLKPSSSSKGLAIELPNPFIPSRSPETGRWAPPKYSRRRQAELIKAAKKEGTLHLLPPGPKLPPSKIPKPLTNVLTSRRPIKNLSLSAALGAPVNWVGEVKVPLGAGINTGNRLYAGKKQMFKGHKWERVFKRKSNYRAIMVRDMAQRIRKYRLVCFGLLSRYLSAFSYNFIRSVSCQQKAKSFVPSPRYLGQEPVLTILRIEMYFAADFIFDIVSLIPQSKRNIRFGKPLRHRSLRRYLKWFTIWLDK